MIYQGYGKKVGCGNFYYCGVYNARIGSGRKNRRIPGCRRKFLGTKSRCGVTLVKKRPRPISNRCRCRSYNGIANIRDPGTFMP